MTSLADQLRAVAGQDAARLAHGAKSQPSYLYTGRQAANLTLDDVHGLASNGFSALVQQDSRLSAAADFLLSDKARSTDRSLLSREENAKLDQTLNRTLFSLGPYVLLRPCGQVLEWLIRRFRVHEFNVPALMGMMLPYHEAPQFAQILQIIDLGPIFAPFTAVKKTMQTMTRNTLVSLMSRNIDLLRFVANLLQESARINIGYRALTGFWAASLHAYISTRKAISHEDMSAVMPSIFTVIKWRKNTEAQLAGLVVLTSLSKRTELTAEALKNVLTVIAGMLKHLPIAEDADSRANEEAALTTIVVVCQHQNKLDRLSTAIMEDMLGRPSTAPTLLALAHSHDIGNFLSPFFATLAQGIAVRDDNYAKHLLQFVQPQQGSPSPAISTLDIITEACFDQLEASLETKQEDAALPATLIQALWLIKQRDPELFSKHLSTVEKPAVAKAIADGVKQYLSDDSKNGSSDVHDPDATVRAQFYTSLFANPRQFAASESANHLLSALSDDSEKVIALFKTVDLAKFEKLPPFKDVSPKSEKILAMDDLDDNSFASIVTFMCNIGKISTQQDAVVQSLWPRLLQTQAGKQKSAIIWESLQKAGLLTGPSFLNGCPDLSLPALDFNRKLGQCIASELLRCFCSLTKGTENAVKHKDGLKTVMTGSREDSDAASRLLTILVLVEMLKITPSATKDTALAAVQLLKVNSQFLPDADSKVSTEIDDTFLQEIFSDPRAAKTNQYAYAVLLRTVAVNYKPAEAADLSKDEICFDLYTIMHQLKLKAAATLVASNLFNRLLKQEGLAFLAKIWLDACANGSEEAAVRALTDASEVVARSATENCDYQIYLATVYRPLMHSDRRIRAAALKLVKSMAASANEHPPKASDTALPLRFIAPESADVETLTAEQTATYLTILTEQGNALEADPAHLSILHSELLSLAKAKPIKKPKKMVSSVLALNATLVASNTARSVVGLDILRAFRLVQNTEYSFGLWTTTQSLFQRPLPLLAGLSPAQKAELVFLLFENAKKSKADIFLPEAVARLISAVKSTDQDADSNLVRTNAMELLVAIFSKLSLAQTMQAVQALIEIACDGGHDSATMEKAKLQLSRVELDEANLIGLLSSVKLELTTQPTPQKRPRLSNADTTNDKTLSVAHLLAIFDLLDWSSVPPSVLLANSVLSVASLALTELGTHALLPRILEAAYKTGALIIGRLQPDLITPELSVAPAIEGLRTTTPPRALAAALQVIATAASHCPDQIARHVIPLFTFMSINVMQKEDKQSQGLLQNIINTVLPAVVHYYKTTAASHAEFAASMSGLVQTFTEAAKHVPRHRQTALFVDFIFAIGSQDFLSTVLSKLFQTSSGKSKGPAKPLDKDSLVAITQHFPYRDQLHALCQLSGALSGLVTSKSNILQPQAAFMETYLLHRQTQAQMDSARAIGDAVYDQGLEDVVKSVVQACAAASKNHNALETLDAVAKATAQVISPAALAEAITWIYKTQDEKAIYAATRLLRSRLVKMRPSQRADLASVTQLALSKLSKDIGSKVNDKVFVAESVATLKFIARGATPEELTVVATAFDAFLLAAGDALARNLSVAVSITMTLAEIEKHLATRLVAKVPAILRFAGQWAGLSLDNNLSGNSSACVSGLLDGLASSIPEFLGPHAERMMDLALQVGDNTAIAKLPPKITLPALRLVYQKTEQKAALLELAGHLVDSATTKDVTLQQRGITALVTDAYNGEAEIVEPAHALFLSMTLKLSGSAFRPIFLRLVDWAFVNDSTPKKRATVFNLMARLLTRLEDVILPYFAHLSENIQSTLGDFARGNNMDLAEWTSAMECLVKAFTLQDEDFWTPTRLEPFAAILAGQHDQSHTLTRQRMSMHLRPAVSSFAKLCIPHERLLKQLNQAVLRKTAVDDDGNKLEAVLSLGAMWAAAGDDLAQFVPESIPALLELLESDTAEVAQAARTLIATIEGILGESLDAQIA